MQKLLSKARKAIQDFDMIQENDKIAVGLSGGKDSLTLLHILKNYQIFSLSLALHLPLASNLLFFYVVFSFSTPRVGRFSNFNRNGLSIKEGLRNGLSSVLIFLSLFLCYLHYH